MLRDPLTIQEAQHMFDAHGTLFVCDADALACVVFDDEEDEAVAYPITIVSYE